MAGLAQALQVVRVEEQKLIAFMGFDVIHHAGLYHQAALLAKTAKRLQGQLRRAQGAPAASPVQTLVSLTLHDGEAQIKKRLDIPAKTAEKAKPQNG